MLTTVLTLVVPVLLVAAQLVVARTWAPELPDPVAVHFGSDGADGFASLAAALWLPSAIALALATGCWAVAFFWGRAAAVRRVCAGMAIGLTTFLMALSLLILQLQRGLADAAQTGPVTPVMTVAFLVALGPALLAARLVPGDPRQPTTDPIPESAATLELAADETASWVTHAESRVALVVGGSAVVLVAAVGLLLSAPFVLVPALLVGTAVATSTWFTVTVDRRGLSVRSAVGWPRMSIPLDEVLGAEQVTVSPFHEFGGWGYRVGRGGRVGVVLRAGVGLQVARTGGRSFVVTVDDAATGAALLNTLAARSRVHTETRGTPGSR
jgi:hypothetical protein